MTVVYLLLLALAAFCFLLSSAGRVVNRGGRQVNLVSLGLFLWVLVPLIETVRHLVD